MMVSMALEDVTPGIIAPKILLKTIRCSALKVEVMVVLSREDFDSRYDGLNWLLMELSPRALSVIQK